MNKEPVSRPKGMDTFKKKAEAITAYGTLILATATVILAIQTWVLADKTSSLVKGEHRQREDLINRTNAEFMYKFYEDYFTEDCRTLITLLDMNQLIYISDPSDEQALNNIVKKYPGSFPKDSIKKFAKKFPALYPIFWIKSDYKEFKRLVPNKDYYTSYEMDDIILNPMDNLGQYFTTRIISDSNYVHTAFGWYVSVIMENRPVKEYLIWLREIYDEETAHIHGLEDLYFMARHKYSSPEKYNDSLIRNDNFKCIKKEFIWCRPKDVKLQHE